MNDKKEINSILIVLVNDKFIFKFFFVVYFGYSLFKGMEG